jgi:uncharacterized protein
MKSKFFFALCLVVLPACALSQVTVSVAPEAASKEDVQKLFDVMASRDQMHQMMQQVFAQMRTLNREQIKKRHPDVTDEELARLDRQSEDFIKNFPVDEMLNDMVPIYQRHFTKSEIDSLTTFYSSPAGQKFLHEMPSVTAESMKVLFPRVQAEVESALKRAEEKEEKTDSPK